MNENPPLRHHGDEWIFDALDWRGGV